MFFDYFTEDNLARSSVQWRRMDHRGDLVAQAIARNIERLFNTSIDFTLDEYLNTKLTVKHFGLPDIVNLHLMRLLPDEKLHRCLKRALQAFEPRLDDVKIEKEDIEGVPSVVIKGHINGKTDQEIIPFLYRNLKK